MDTKNMVDYLTMIANTNLYLNFGLHLFIISSLGFMFLLKGSNIKQYVIGGSILILFLSVTVNAMIFGNPFHAITFGILLMTSGYMLVLMRKISMTWEWRTNFWTVISVFIIFLGLWYPELANVNRVESLLLSPVGVIPCPTLITALGIMNLFSTFINRKLFFITIVFSMMYGFIGSFRFGVYFDIILICAALLSLSTLFIKRVKNL